MGTALGGSGSLSAILIFLDGMKNPVLFVYIFIDAFSIFWYNVGKI